MGHYVAKGSVFLVTCVFLWEWCVYHIWCRPWWLYAIIFNIAWAMALLSYAKTAFTDPGTARSPEWAEWSSKRSAEQAAATSSLAAADSARGLASWRPGEVTWCKACKAERPERAHHCSTCGVCILRMDHHCPWLGTCVGWRNHKYFLLMAFWTFMASLIFILTLRGPNTLEALAIGDYDDSPAAMVVWGVMAAFMFMVVTLGVFMHVMYMAARNRTVVEDLFLNDDNPYMHPSMLDNLHQTFGDLDRTTLMPVQPKGRPSGTSFPIRAVSAAVTQYGAA